MFSFDRLLLTFGFLAVTTDAAEHAFVLLGPTGDNSLRDNGVWQGLFESWTGGVYDASTVQIHPTMNTPHTEESLETAVLESLGTLYEALQDNPGWSCQQDDCDPKTFYDDLVTGNVNIQDGRDAFKQSESMIPAMEDYKTISVYLSVPPYTFGDWATATAQSFGSDRVVVAAEKPFGDSVEGANSLYEDITGDGNLAESHLLLVDHWLSFFMLKNLPNFRKVATECLGVEWSSESFSKIVITEHETRGLEGRGGFFDGVGQVRDMIQSHLLQVLGLLLIDPEDDDRAKGKLDVFENVSVKTCTHGQYDGFLLEPKLGYHEDFADATYSTMFLDMNMENWKETDLEITTGKDMGMMLYTVDMHQAGGPGVLTFDIGAESVGLADIKMTDWPLANGECSVTVPAPGFDNDLVMTMSSSSDDEVTGTTLVSYDTDSLYFPKPYAVMLSSMITKDYEKGFVTFPEVNQQWIVVTAGSPSICLDPPGDAVRVYKPPESCGNTPPRVCYTDYTVQDLYDVKFECTPENDEEWMCLNFYQDKCGLDWNPPECDGWTPPSSEEEHDSHDHSSHDHASETDSAAAEEEHDSHDHSSHDNASETDSAAAEEEHDSHDHSSHDHAGETDSAAAEEVHDSHDHSSHDHDDEEEPVVPGGCKGGNTFNGGGNDECNCYGTSCTQDSCENGMGGVWTDECPICNPEECDPLAPSDDDPSCTGPPEMIDRFGKKMYRRKLIAREKPQDSPEGVFCHITLQLCPGESQLTQGIDTGFGDFFRIAATPEWANYTGTPEYSYSGMHKPDGARSYSPVTPLNENVVQLTLKEYTSGDGSAYDCTPGVDCKFGMSELVCMAPIGTDFLLSINPDHAGYTSTHQAYVPNFSREPGNGPYTINVIGQGVALTELNILAMSELLAPFSSDGNFSNIESVNYLWANSYWSNAEWVWEPTESTDLSRQFMRDMGKYGIRFNLMHAISREERPEAQYPRTNTTVIGWAFNLTNTTDQDPNIKWFVVGSGSYKKSIYPQILEWGFDMSPCNKEAAKKGYPYCGPNALYDHYPAGLDPDGRERSELFKMYEEIEAEQMAEEENSHDHSSHDHSSHDHSSHDHAEESDAEGMAEEEDSHDHSSHDHAEESDAVGMAEEEDSHDHSSHDHAEESDAVGMAEEEDSHDHSSHDHAEESDAVGMAEEEDSQDHSSHDHSSHDHAEESDAVGMAKEEDSHDHSSHDHSSHDHAGTHDPRGQTPEDCLASGLQTIRGIACRNDNFRIMCKSIQAIDSEFMLSSSSVYTAFFPTDEAFNEVEDFTSTLSDEQIVDIFLFHFIDGEVVDYDDLECKETIYMSNGKTSRTVCRGGEKYQRGKGNYDSETLPMIVKDGSIEACNGVVHVLDHVMLPNDIPVDSMVGK